MKHHRQEYSRPFIGEQANGCNYLSPPKRACLAGANGLDSFGICERGSCTEHGTSRAVHRDIALLTGNGVVVIDVDDPAMVNTVLKRCGETPMRCRTPNGMHLYYAMPEGAPTKVALFVMTLPYSDGLFCCAFPRECTEAFLEGHCRAFEFFGGVPRRISYDNSKIAIAKITGSRTREVTREFQRLQSHFCLRRTFAWYGGPTRRGMWRTWSATRVATSWCRCRW